MDNCTFLTHHSPLTKILPFAIVPIMQTSPGQWFRLAVEEEHPLQLVGVINAYVALMARRADFRALYLSGAGVANACYGLPDLAVTTLDNVVEETRRITGAVDLPLLVDIDTGWGHALMVERAIRELERAGAAGVHIEDQVFQKRCGHRDGKQLVPQEEMVARVTAAVQARRDNSFVIIARTDAAAGEGLERAIERCEAYIDAGADMIFAEALTSLDQYRVFTDRIKVPVLANCTEFGKTPLFTAQELAESGVKIVLYPLSVFRAMNRAAEETLQTIRHQGSQKTIVPRMQTRDELYSYLGYEALERKLRGE